jgi:vacuolar-type H+-ATPase subunit E/Vma4
VGGYPALLAVLSEEAAREAAAIRAAAEAQRAALLDAARRDAAAALEERRGRTRREAEVAGRAALDAVALERERTVFLEQRSRLEALRADVEARLLESGDAEVLDRLLPELLAEAGEGAFTVVVDPGDEAAARRVLAKTPALDARATVVAGTGRSGGATVIAGRRVLDGTLRSRLARAWAALEPDLAARLFREGG